MYSAKNMIPSIVCNRSFSSSRAETSITPHIPILLLWSLVSISKLGSGLFESRPHVTGFLRNERSMCLNIPHNLLLSRLVPLLLLQMAGKLKRMHRQHAHIVSRCIQVLFQIVLTFIEEIHDMRFSFLVQFDGCLGLKEHILLFLLILDHLRGLFCGCQTTICGV